MSCDVFGGRNICKLTSVGSIETVGIPGFPVIKTPAPLTIAFVEKIALRSIQPVDWKEPAATVHVKSGMESDGNWVTPGEYAQPSHVRFTLLPAAKLPDPSI